MSPMRLLLVEDEALLAHHLRRGLQEESFAVDIAGSVAEANALAEETPYDLVILDVMLPDGSGIDLLSEWRRNGFEAPVLVLTARDRLDDKLRGFETGADDYLTKPFDFEELLARLHNLLRRRHVPPVDVLTFADLRLDRARREVWRGGRLLDLTPKEFALLEYLMLHAGRVLDRITLAEHVWDAGHDARSNVIEVLIGRLRRKMDEAGGPPLLQTVKGVGYVLRAASAEDT